MRKAYPKVFSKLDPPLFASEVPSVPVAPYSIVWDDRPIDETNEFSASCTTTGNEVGGDYRLTISGEGAPDIVRTGQVTAPGGGFQFTALDCSVFLNGQVLATYASQVDVGGEWVWAANVRDFVIKVALTPNAYFDFADYPEATFLEDIAGWENLSLPQSAQVGIEVLNCIITGESGWYQLTDFPDVIGTTIGMVSIAGINPDSSFQMCFGVDGDNYVGLRAITTEMAIYSRIAGVWALIGKVAGATVTGDHVFFTKVGEDYTIIKNGQQVFSFNLSGSGQWRAGVNTRKIAAPMFSEFALWDHNDPITPTP